MTTTTIETPLQRAAFLLEEASSATLPDTYNCCTEDSMCPDHLLCQDAADLVSAIRDAVIAAADEDEAGRLIAAILRGKPAGAGRTGGTR